ncbi:hypothetical protein GS399_13375 [Pedobacter sp. HMF7647]|uniref:HD domain-containing protein n=1 Tax=Hufsiella arboris TaxID=2695275 RepID=A0A7K1YD41_9SPHI|nr:hypothetical protein [Hufsiella arboris]MXV51968.1 hypothetical protein [Hufsiella arboris]
MESLLIVREIERFVRELFLEKLPDDMYFHNLTHTQYVVNAVTEIGFYSNVSRRDMLILRIASWFHDTGYCFEYSGHEERSIGVASSFLIQHNCDDSLIEEVVNCVRATKIPQSPENLLQQIICDADMFHLSDDDFINMSDRLRKEWGCRLNKEYTDREWLETSLHLLSRHRYFTDYGQKVMQSHKLENIVRLKRLWN